MNRHLKVSLSAPAMQSKLGDLGLMSARLYFGLAMALNHGVKKVPPSDRWVNFVGELGFPMSELFAWSAGLTELIGGALIALGLCTRVSSGLLMMTMLVAVFIGHAGDPFSKQELGLCYLFASLLFLTLGGGRYSLDHKLFSRSKDL